MGWSQFGRLGPREGLGLGQDAIAVFALFLVLFRAEVEQLIVHRIVLSTREVIGMRPCQARSNDNVAVIGDVLGPQACASKDDRVIEAIERTSASCEVLPKLCACHGKGGVAQGVGDGERIPFAPSTRGREDETGIVATPPESADVRCVRRPDWPVGVSAGSFDAAHLHQKKVETGLQQVDANSPFFLEDAAAARP